MHSGTAGHWVQGHASRRTHLVVISEELVEEVEGFRGHQVLVVAVDEFGPGFARVAPHQLLQLRVQLDAILLQVPVQLIRPQHLHRLLLLHTSTLAGPCSSAVVRDEGWRACGNDFQGG